MQGPQGLPLTPASVREALRAADPAGLLVDRAIEAAVDTICMGVRVIGNVGSCLRCGHALTKSKRCIDAWVLTVGGLVPIRHDVSVAGMP